MSTIGKKVRIEVQLEGGRAVDAPVSTPVAAGAPTFLVVTDATLDAFLQRLNTYQGKPLSERLANQLVLGRMLLNNYGGEDRSQTLEGTYNTLLTGVTDAGRCSHIHALLAATARAQGLEGAGVHSLVWMPHTGRAGNHAVTHYKHPDTGTYLVQNYNQDLFDTGQKTIEGMVDVSQATLGRAPTASEIESLPGHYHLYMPSEMRWMADRASRAAERGSPIRLTLGSREQGVAGGLDMPGWRMFGVVDRYGAHALMGGGVALKAENKRARASASSGIYKTGTSIVLLSQANAGVAMQKWGMKLSLDGHATHIAQLRRMATAPPHHELSATLSRRVGAAEVSMKHSGYVAGNFNDQSKVRPKTAYDRLGAKYEGTLGPVQLAIDGGVYAFSYNDAFGVQGSAEAKVGPVSASVDANAIVANPAKDPYFDTQPFVQAKLKASHPIGKHIDVSLEGAAHNAARPLSVFEKDRVPVVNDKADVSVRAGLTVKF